MNEPYDYVKIIEAATKLYMAGYWTTDKLSIDEQIKMWEDLRDVLQIEKGTATSAGVGNIKSDK